MPRIERFQPRDLGPKPWGRELLIAETDQYIGKVLWMKAGQGGHLQHHELKDETFYLLSGEATVRFTETPDGPVIGLPMYPGQAYHVPPGAVHQVIAVTDCVFVEASTPVFNDRVVAEAFEGVPV